MNTIMRSRICVFIALHGFIFLMGCPKSTDNDEKEKWFIYPPSKYRHVNDPEIDRVFQWLQGEPLVYVRPWMEKVPSPYTYDEWVNQGREINHAEEILIDCYNHYTGEIHLASIIFGLQQVGTFRSVPTLIQIVSDENMDDNERCLGVSALAAIGDPSCVDVLIKVARSTVDAQNESGIRNILHSNSIGALCDIGDPRAIPFLEDWLQNTKLPDNVHEHYRSIMDLLKQNQKKFIQDWILRWHLANPEKNSRGLPYYLSMKKWAIAGKEIPAVGHILLEIYQDEEKKVSRDSILFAIGAVGSNEDIRQLLNLILNDPDFNHSEMESVFRSMFEIRGVSVLDEIIPIIESCRFNDEETEYEIKSSLLNVFSGPDLNGKLNSVRKRNEELKGKINPGMMMR